jgi:hypothetical protein
MVEWGTVGNPGLETYHNFHWTMFFLCFIDEQVSNLCLFCQDRKEIGPMYYLAYAQVNKYGPVPAETHRKSLVHGSSIPAGNCPDFSDHFRPVPVETHRKLTGIQRKNPEHFRCFPAGSGHSPTSFLPDLTGSGSPNLQIGYLRFPFETIKKFRINLPSYTSS